MEVRLFATLRENRGNTVEIEWTEGMDGQTLLKTLGLNEKDAAVFLVNGINSKADVVLKKDDVIAIFPPIGGG